MACDNGCCNTTPRIVQLPASSTLDGGPYTVNANTPDDGVVRVTDTTSGEFFDIDVHALQCNVFSERLVLDTSASTAGADFGSGTAVTALTADGLTDPGEAAHQAYIDANIDYSAPASDSTSLNPPDTGAIGQTDSGWVAFHVVVPAGGTRTLTWEWAGEGYGRLEVAECGVGDYEIVDSVWSPVGTTSQVTVTLDAGVHLVRMTQVDSGGNANAWAYVGDPIEFYTESGAAPVVSMQLVAVDCDGNAVDVNGDPLVGTLIPVADWPCPISNVTINASNIVGDLFNVTAGATAAAGDDSLGSATIQAGETLHFYQGAPGDPLQVDEGSGIVRLPGDGPAAVNIECFEDVTGNLYTIGENVGGTFSDGEGPEAVSFEWVNTTNCSIQIDSVTLWARNPGADFDVQVNVASGVAGFVTSPNVTIPGGTAAFTPFTFVLDNPEIIPPGEDFSVELGSSGANSVVFAVTDQAMPPEFINDTSLPAGDFMVARLEGPEINRYNVVTLDDGTTSTWNVTDPANPVEATLPATARCCDDEQIVFPRLLKTECRQSVASGEIIQRNEYNDGTVVYWSFDANDEAPLPDAIYYGSTFQECPLTDTQIGQVINIVNCATADLQFSGLENGFNSPHTFDAFTPTVTGDHTFTLTGTDPDAGTHVLEMLIGTTPGASDVFDGTGLGLVGASGSVDYEVPLTELVDVYVTLVASGAATAYWDIISVTSTCPADPIECCRMGDQLVDADTPLTPAAPAQDGLGMLANKTGADIVFDTFGGAVESTEDVALRMDDGCEVPLRLTVAHIGGTGGGAWTVAADGRMFHSAGGSNYVLTLEVLADAFGTQPALEWQLHAGSIGNGEDMVFNAGQALGGNEVTAFAQGAGGQNISGSLPYSGTWSNNNNNAQSGFGFDASTSLTFQKNGSTAAGGTVIVSAAQVPNAVEVTTCDLVDLVSDVVVSCQLETVSLAAGDFTYTDAAANLGGVYLGGAGGDSGIAAIDVDLGANRSGTRHVLQYGQSKNAAGGPTPQLRAEVRQFGVVIASEEFAAAEPPTVTQTLEFYPTANFEVRFIDLTAPGASSNRDAAITAITVEATCEGQEESAGGTGENAINIECFQTESIVTPEIDHETGGAPDGTFSTVGASIAIVPGPIGTVYDTIRVLVRNLGVPIIGQTLAVTSDGNPINGGTVTDPFDIPSGDSVVTMTFPPVTVDAAIAADGEILVDPNFGGWTVAIGFSTIGTSDFSDSQNTLQPAFGQIGSGGVVTSEYRTVTLTDGTVTTYDENDAVATLPAGAVPCGLNATQLAEVSEAAGDSCKIVDCVETRGTLPVTIDMPDDYTLVTAYDVTANMSDGSTLTFSRNANQHADADDQAVNWAAAFTNQADGTWTASGPQISANLDPTDAYPTSINVEVSRTVGFNSGQTTEITPNLVWETSNSDLTGRVELGSLDAGSVASGGNGITTNISVAGSPDTLSISSTFPGWTAPDRFIVQVHDLDPGANEFIEFDLVPDVVFETNPNSGGSDYTLTGSRIDPLVNNVDIRATFEGGVTSVTAQQRTFQGGSQRVGYRQFITEWDFPAAVTVGEASVITLTRCGDEFTDSNGDAVPAPAEFVACGTYAALDALAIQGAHADDAAAGAAGLTAGQRYQTDGTGAAPLNVPGIVMVKQ